jgi:hypothetical protein
MIIVRVDVLDGKGLIDIAVGNYKDEERIKRFFADAKTEFELNDEKLEQEK